MGHHKRNERRRPVDASVPMVRCPKCGRIQPSRGNNAVYFCDHCRMMFDDNPDEGGDWSDRNPAARIERAERGR